jgi:RNA recognition motif-containing protein
MDRNLTPTPGIYIGNLLFDVTADDIKREFEEFGPIKNVNIATDARGLSKGFGYVEFETTEQATAAIEAKHQTTFEGRRLVVNYIAKTQRPSSNNPPSKTLFIGNLAFEMSDTDLNKLFRDIRNVIDVRVAIDRRTGQPRGFAHADFLDTESAVKGMEFLQGKEIYGRTLRVDYSIGSRESRGDGSGDRGGDGGRERRDRF